MEYLRISSIGYSTVRLRTDCLKNINSLVIFLKPAIIQLDEVLVQASRVSARDFVKEAIHSLEKNTYPKDYLIQWYSSMVSTDSASGYYYTLETVFDDYHIGDQARRTIRQQREKGISPTFVRDPKDTLCTLVPWFEIELAQIVNAKYGVFNLNNLDAFSFTYDGVVGLDGDSVYVVEYQAINVRYAVTGYTSKNLSYKGRLYITTENYAVVRHTLEIAVKAKKYEDPERHFIKEEVFYKKIDNYYFPYYIKSTRNLDVNRNFKPFHSNTYILKDVRLENIEYQAGYNWCGNRAPYDKDFWTLNYPQIP